MAMCNIHIIFYIVTIDGALIKVAGFKQEIE